MAKNYMADVVKMLGVELEEEFYLGSSELRYKITSNGLCYKNDKGWFRHSDCALVELIKGVWEIKKLPWKPKKGEKYYYVSWCKENGKWIISAAEQEYWPTFDGDVLRVDIGNFFQTIETAEAQKYEVFKRLTGKEWSETYGEAGEGE